MILCRLFLSLASYLVDGYPSYYSPFCYGMSLIFRMHSGRSRRQTADNPPRDIISDLPSHLIEAILTCLPLRYAVRTSVLSKKWRDKWVNIPKLVFDDAFLKVLAYEEDSLFNRNELMMTIYQVLLRHCGPILTFTLSVSWLESCPQIDQLILFLSANGIREFNFKIKEGESYKLPWSFFSCLQLRHLNLNSCVFKPPPSFRGFSKLTTLHFGDVDIDAHLFGNLISSCPLLEHLTLVSSMRFDHLEIDAPKLKYFGFGASFSCIRFKNTPLLASLGISLGEFVYMEYLKDGESSRMIDVFGSLPVIETMYLGYHFRKFLMLGGVPETLPFTLNHLKGLILMKMCFWEVLEVLFALCLIKSSPNLEEIIIHSLDGTNADERPVLQLLEGQYHSEISFNQLRTVRVRFLSGARSEFEFIKLLLAKSPMLEEMFIVPHQNKPHEGLTMLRELTRFRRASQKAKIIYM